VRHRAECESRYIYVIRAAMVLFKIICVKFLI